MTRSTAPRRRRRPRRPAQRVLLAATTDLAASPLLDAYAQAIEAGGFLVDVTTIESLAEVVHSFGPHLLVVDEPLAAARARMAALGVSPSMVILIGLSDPRERADALNARFADATPVPVHPVELAARVAAAIRRTVGSVAPSGLLRAGSMTLDEAGRRVNLGGEWVSLTAIETRLLGFLLRRPGVPHRRETLLEEVWGHSIGDLATVTVHIRRLRSKIELDPSEPKVITTVWGVGYRLDPLGG